MRVTLIASTQLTGIYHDSNFNYEEWMPEHEEAYDYGTTDADRLAEFAGRSCYRAFNKPNPKTRENADYLANILKLQHESVLEHASATFFVENVSRALLLELERHRHLSFSVVSQRYVNHSDAEHVIPPVFKGDADAERIINSAHYDALLTYDTLVGMAIEKGLSRKEARGAARTVLPEGTETSIVLTANHRAYRYVIKLRSSPHADAEIREFAQALLVELKKISPNAYQDMMED